VNYIERFVIIRLFTSCFMDRPADLSDL